MQTITINSFTYHNKMFVSSKPLVFEVIEDTVKEENEIKTFYSIENEEYNIEAFGDTLAEVSNDLLEELCFNWANYALKDEDHLSEKAKIVRKNYLETFKETL